MVELSLTTTQTSNRRENDTYNFAVLQRTRGTRWMACYGVWGVDKFPFMNFKISRVGKTFLGRTMLPEVSSDVKSPLKWMGLF